MYNRGMASENNTTQRREAMTSIDYAKERVNTTAGTVALWRRLYRESPNIGAEFELRQAIREFQTANDILDELLRKGRKSK